tara:strand:+ start:366 stop:533 length:168 start_codon:yes stop_codon:yes gene_type:complete
MNEKEKIKNLQKALGVIRKGVLDFQQNAEKDGDNTKAETSREILEMVTRVINIYG